MDIACEHAETLGLCGVIPFPSASVHSGQTCSIEACRVCFGQGKPISKRRLLRQVCDWQEGVKREELLVMKLSQVA